MKSIQIRSYFWSGFSCIRTEYRKIRTRNNSVFGHFSRVVNNIKNNSLVKDDMINMIMINICGKIYHQPHWPRQEYINLTQLLEGSNTNTGRRKPSDILLFPGGYTNVTLKAYGLTRTIKMHYLLPNYYIKRTLDSL